MPYQINHINSLFQAGTDAPCAPQPEQATSESEMVRSSPRGGQVVNGLTRNRRAAVVRRWPPAGTFVRIGI